MTRQCSHDPLTIFTRSMQVKFSVLNSCNIVNFSEWAYYRPNTNIMTLTCEYCVNMLLRPGKSGIKSEKVREFEAV